LTASSLCAISGKKDAAASSPGKEVRAAERQETRRQLFVKARVHRVVQLAPLLVERKTPPPAVPAKRFVPERAGHSMIWPVLALV